MFGIEGRNMSSVWVRVPAALLLALLIVLSVTVSAAAYSVPFQIEGYVSVGGLPANGVLVSCNGDSVVSMSDSSGNAGYYVLMPPGITLGSPVTVSFSYNGASSSTTFTANGDSVSVPAVNIVPTPVPTQTPTPVPTQTPTPVPTQTPTQTPTATPTPSPSPSPSPTPTLSPSVSPTPMPSIFLSSFVLPSLVIGATMICTRRMKRDKK
jgi:cell division septation protein DedD